MYTYYLNIWRNMPKETSKIVAVRIEIERRELLGEDTCFHYKPNSIT
jgi:hypothetical protein